MNCLDCGRLVKKPKRYCTNACQQNFARQQRTNKWLTTGKLDTIWDITHHGHFVRVYLMKQQDGNCALCKGPQKWMGNLLTFILDHVDGDAKNNARDNLRLVCPNCESQLETSKGKNRGRGTRSPRENRYY